MNSKKKSCQNWKLYVIADPAALKNGRDLKETVRLAILGGADAIQLRNKRASNSGMIEMAKSLLEVTRPHGIPLIINDRPEVAKASGADGLHLGQEDGSLKEARVLLGEKAILGRSTHTPAQALQAQKEGADYIGVGPVFKTPTKPDTKPAGLKLVAFAAQNISIPFVAIGGVDSKNVCLVRNAGARAVAVVRAVMHAENPKAAAANLLLNFQKKGLKE